MSDEVNVSELRTIVNTIFDHIEHDLGIKSVPLTKDYYWTVSDNDRFDMTKPPAGFGAGQLYDDWEFLRPILKEKHLAVSYMLVHVAPVLRWLGEEVGQ